MLLTQKLDIRIGSGLSHRPVEVVGHRNRNDVVHRQIRYCLLSAPSPCTFLISVPYGVFVNAVAEFAHLLLEKVVAHILLPLSHQWSKFPWIVALCAWSSFCHCLLRQDHDYLSHRILSVLANILDDRFEGFGVKHFASCMFADSAHLELC